MEPLDLRTRPPRSCYDDLDGLMLVPRTIDKLRGFLPGGNPGEFIINGRIKGISGFLLEQLGITEDELRAVVADAESDDDVAAWLRDHTDPSRYATLNETLRRIKPKHAEDPAYFAEYYRETIAAHPEAETIFDILEADDRRIFPEHFR
ncbi:MAG: DUF5069 domain-containing protein [bacterium]|nr:DUF5069 domain-containing protein [bacterium]